MCHNVFFEGCWFLYVFFDIWYLACFWGMFSLFWSECVLADCLFACQWFMLVLCLLMFAAVRAMKCRKEKGAEWRGKREKRDALLFRDGLLCLFHRINSRFLSFRVLSSLCHTNLAFLSTLCTEQIKCSVCITLPSIVCMGQMRVWCERSYSRTLFPIKRHWIFSRLIEKAENRLLNIIAIQQQCLII